MTWCEQFASAGRVTLNFHPDRVTSLGMTVAEGLHSIGQYLSQYKTGFSNGGRTAVTGGDRLRWEHELFGDAYDNADPADRPVYGALDLLWDPHGGSPRFGSSFVVLKEHVRVRTTLCVGDSHARPRDVGTFSEPAHLLAGLAEQASNGDLLGRGLGVDALLEALAKPPVSSPGRVLDHYVEAQVHGPVVLAGDVEAIVVDPSFKGTDTGQHLLDAGERYGFTVTWHRGSELNPGEVPDDFRRADTPNFARRIARDDGLVDAAAIGRAALQHPMGPPTPTGDPDDSPLQKLKYVWHAVVAIGHDAEPPPPA